MSGAAPTRILYIADSLMAGGIESQLVELVTRLNRDRFEPHVLCLYGPTARDLHFAPTLQAAGIPLITPDLGWGARDKARGVVAIRSAARALHPAIIQAEGYHANLLLRMAVPMLPRDLRVVGTVRGVPTAKQLRYDRLGARFCDRIVVNAPHLAKLLMDGARIPRQKICHIPNGITLERYQRPTNPTLRGRIAPEAHRVLVSMGRISFEKNMHWIAQALGMLARERRLPNATRAFIVGDVHHPQALQLLESAISADHLEDIIAICPQTAHPEDIYNASDVTLLVSPNEGLPNVAIESLAAGKPVIISEAANAAGVIEHGVTGWIVPTGDIAQLADMLAMVLALSDGLLAARRPACLARAQDYSADKLVARYTGFYDELLAPAPRP